MKENYNNMELIMRYESEKRLGSVTQQIDYIRIWVKDSGRRLARVLCKDKSALVRISRERREASK